LGLDGIT